MSPSSPSSSEPTEPPRGEISSGEIEPRNSTPRDSERGEIFDLDALESPEKPRSRVGWGLGILLGVLLGGYGLFTLGVLAASKNQAPEPVGPFVAANTTIVAKPKEADIKVHVVGRVKKPGVYALPMGARIQDALHRAGGPLPGADTEALNLADWVKDGARIEVAPKATPTPIYTPTPVVIERIVRVPVEVERGKANRKNKTANSPAAARNSASAQKAVPNGAEPSKSAAPKVKKSDPTYLETLKREPINLNTASVEELQKLPGVGPKMAERIVAHRAENGPFANLEALNEVKGIGEKKLEAMKEFAVVK